MIGLELEALAKKFDRFGWEKSRGTVAHDRQVSDFMDALQNYGLDEIRDACRQLVLSNPDKMPNEGHVMKQIIKARGRVSLPSPPPPDPPKKRVTPERAAEIMAEVFGDKGMPDIDKRMPEGAKI